MTTMKRFSLFALCTLTIFTSLHPDDLELNELNDDDISLFSSKENAQESKDRFFDDLDADQFLDNATDDFLGDAAFVPSPMSRLITPEDLVTILAGEEIDAISILQEDYYLRTTPFNKRNVVDLPMLELGPCCRNKKWNVGFHIFYNQTDRMNFTKSSTNLTDYLALSQETLIQKLATLIIRVGDFQADKEDFAELLSKLDVDKIFSLFRTMAVQDRRVGFAWWLERIEDKTRLRAVIPMYYQERNFFLTDQEKDIADQELAEAFGLESGEDDEEFQNAHFISDKFGFGDTRIEIDCTVYDSDSFFMRLGTQFTLPTAFAFKKGIRGTSFEKPCTLPTLDVLQLGCILAGDDPDNDEQEREDIFQLLSPFFLEALDRLSANLLETGLGNGGHVGVGVVTRMETYLWKFLAAFRIFPGVSKHCPWLEQMTWQNRMSLEYLFPRSKKRFFAQENNPAAFDSRDFQSRDPVIGASNLAFLEQEFINKFHPSVYRVRVAPGIIFHSTSKLCYHGTCWDFYLGTDIWVKTRDRLTHIQAPLETKKQLDLAKAKPFWAYQGKLMAGLSYRREQETHDWHFNIHVDGAFSGSGIGQDYSLAISIERNF